MLIGFLTLLTVNENAVFAAIVDDLVSVTFSSVVLSLLQSIVYINVVELKLQLKLDTSGKATSVGNLI